MGAAIIERFAWEGARSIVADVNDVGGSAAAAAIGDAARFARLDVTDPDVGNALGADIREWEGRLDILSSSSVRPNP